MTIVHGKDYPNNISVVKVSKSGSIRNISVEGVDEMKGSYYSHRGVNKQYTMRQEKRPSAEAKKHAEDMLWDENTLRCFVDASELDFQGIFGFGACFISNGTVIVKNKKHYRQDMRKKNSYAELMAVIFALEQLEMLLDKKSFTPSKFLLYSDWQGVEDIDNPTKNKETNALRKRINELRDRLLKTNNLELEIAVMDKEFKRSNPFYQSAHNQARKILR